MLKYPTSLTPPLVRAAVARQYGMSTDAEMVGVLSHWIARHAEVAALFVREHPEALPAPQVDR